MLRRLFRRNYGIAVRRVGVRSELSWHWRFLLWMALLSVSFAMAGWIYDAGRRIAGFDRQEYERERAEALDRISSLEKQLGRAQEDVRAGEGRLNVETAAVTQLAAQLKTIQKENVALKEELALFEGLVSSGRDVSAPLVRAPRVSIERVDGRRFRYRLMLVHQSPQKMVRDFNGEFRFELKVRSTGRDVMMPIPEPGASASSFRLSFKHIHRVEGGFNLPEGVELLGGEVFVSQEGRVLLRQAVSL